MEQASGSNVQPDEENFPPISNNVDDQSNGNSGLGTLNSTPGGSAGMNLVNTLSDAELESYDTGTTGPPGPDSLLMASSSTQNPNHLSRLDEGIKKLEECIMVMSNSIEKNLACICSDTARDLTVLPCGHIFCRPCISQWFKTGQEQCPVCRNPATEAIESESLDNLLVEFESARKQYIDGKAALQDGTISSTLKSPGGIQDLSSIMVEDGLIQQLMIGRRIGTEVVPYGKELHIKIFNARAPAERQNRIEQRRQRRGWHFALPINNQAKMNDIIITFGLLLSTWIGVSIQNHALEEEWSISQVCMAAFAYLWTMFAFLYVYLAYNHN